MKYSYAGAPKVKCREAQLPGEEEAGAGGRQFTTNTMIYAKRSPTIASSPPALLMTIEKVVSNAKHLEWLCSTENID